MKSKEIEEANLKLDRDGDVLVVSFSGPWLLRSTRPGPERIREAIEGGPRPERIRFIADELRSWDSALLNFVRQSVALAESDGLAFDLSGLPPGVCRMMDLVKAAPEADGPGDEPRRGFLEGVGAKVVYWYGGFDRALGFIGQTLIEGIRFFRGHASLRRKDFLIILQGCGAQALPIVSLLSFLTGLIVAFIGVIQLQKFAADIYVADLVGLAMTREMAAVMTGVILAGRTGAAFAAQIGSMRVNEEVDALTVFGISPIQFLVLPRVFALVLMAPLLCAFADFVAILGGLVVAVGISDITATQYFNQIEEAVGLGDFWLGVLKSGVFGLIIALTGCYCGLVSGRDASAVGRAATSAVVIAITWIVVSDAVFAVLCNILGI